jgi:hypothetical protein
LGLEIKAARFGKCDGNPPKYIGQTILAVKRYNCALNRVPRSPICHRQDDWLMNACRYGSREFQKTPSSPGACVGECEEDIVSPFYLLLAPSYGNGLEVEKYDPMFVFSCRLAADGRNEDIIEFFPVIPVQFLVSSSSPSCSLSFSTPTYPSKPI